MRQQLISWLIEDIAPEIRHSKDPEGEILKFSREHNLATAQVQAMGQLYNTAKTLSFFDKSASNRGGSFPIMDVDRLVEHYTSVEKKASMPAPRFEYNDLDHGCGLSLPACFAGLTHNVLDIEQPAPAQIFDNPVKKASLERAETAVTMGLTKQAYFEAQEDMRKSACNIVAELRRNPGYPFDELEADAIAIFGDDVKPIMEKLAKFCQDDGWPVKRATAVSQDKLVMDPGGLMPMIEGIMDRTYLVKAAVEILQPSSEAAGAGPMHTAAKIVDKGKDGEVVLKSASPAPGRTTITDQTLKKAISPNQPGDYGASIIDPAAIERARKPKEPEKESPLKEIPRGPTGLAAKEMGGWLEKHIGKPTPLMKMLPDAKALLPTKNVEQMQVDRDMQDTRHLATLQHLMTTDEILAEADPDRVVSMYNTIRNMSPQIASDPNVMRVVLRSAVQHEGIDPFALTQLLETEIAKQKVEKGIGQAGKERYAVGVKAPSQEREHDEEK